MTSVRLSTKTSDDFQTPPKAWELFQKYVDLKGLHVWSPFYMKGELTLKHDHIIHEDKDFFKSEPDFYNCIVDNPSFSNKRQVLERIRDLEKCPPYALLLPLDTLERVYFKEHMQLEPDFTIIIPNERYNFKGKDDKTNKHNSQKCCWFCFGWGLGREMIWD